MTDNPDEVTNLDIYGFEPLPWSRANDLLVAELPSQDTAAFLGTTRSGRAAALERDRCHAP